MSGTLTESTLHESLAASVRKLATLRGIVAHGTEEIKAARAGFELTIASALLGLEGVKRAMESEESAVRAMALVDHETTGNTKPTAGVSVIEEKNITIDVVAGLAYAKEHGLFLIPEALDVKAVERVATVLPLTFVVMTKVPAVRIASDLGKALEVAS